MKTKISSVLLVGLLALTGNAFALSVTTTNDANTLASNILGSGISLVGSATYTGAAGAAGTFTSGGNVGIGSGILLTSGAASVATGPNDSGGAGVSNGTAGLASLNALIPGYSTNDAAQLSFDFTTAGGNLFFNYVFASEEYNEWVGSSFNDVFAFFLDGVNIALIPSTTTPVSINNVNLGSNSAYYRNNSPGPYDTQYDGLTTVLTAQFLGLGSGTHHIDIAIADAGDYILDSGVFIQGGSFSDTNPNNPVPEPSTMLLLGSGLAGLAFWRKRKSVK
ncbi:MAG: PEP-CTERM sorting domain-containing protein [Geobacteraceae bacterium]|nr:PEP-CTERM sorting domain-containing protein [Geobacteraceae bacterium]NTW80105.1 PEP-CTERM sorting domain-containing protein [Geobacteraceae bacterium]